MPPCDIDRSKVDNDMNMNDGIEDWSMDIGEEYYKKVAGRPRTPFVRASFDSGDNGHNIPASNYNVDINKFEDVVDITDDGTGACDEGFVLVTYNNGNVDDLR
jgi:hypothetical protein